MCIRDRPDVATQYFTLLYFAKAFSNLRIYCPWLDIQLVSMHFDTYSFAFLLRCGTNMGIIQKNSFSEKLVNSPLYPL